jgi:putative methanogenesis marker protein 8
MGRHVIEALGKARIVIEDGRIVEIGDPMISYCPLFNKYRGIETLDEQAIRDNVEFRMRDFGMCTPDRKTRMKDFLSFGVSELLSMALEKGELDAVVMVSDGAGTVILSDPEVAQGIGGRISGMVETEPYDKVIQAIGENRVLDPSTAKIDQLAGAEMAFRMGFQKVGVSVAFAKDAVELRERFGDKVVIFAVHTTGTNKEDAETFFDTCDVITSCASRTIREVAKRRALLQVGSSIPVYAATELGKELMLKRLEQIGKLPSDTETDPPRPLV